VSGSNKTRNAVQGVPHPGTSPSKRRESGDAGVCRKLEAGGQSRPGKDGIHSHPTNPWHQVGNV